MEITDVKIEDFVGVFDTTFDTQPLLDYYAYAEKTGMCVTRRSLPTADQTGNVVKEDTPFYPNTRTDSGLTTAYWAERHRNLSPTSEYMLPLDEHMDYVQGYCGALSKGFEVYCESYEGLTNMQLQHSYFNLQKTLPKQGYHTWHCENTGKHCTRRVLVTMMYLNDDFEGGETEFLYQSLRIQPKKGRMLIWPAGFTHTHRGNPPLSGDGKYIATGWIEAVPL